MFGVMLKKRYLKAVCLVLLEPNGWKLILAAQGFLTSFAFNPIQ